ncbi:MAG TPA: RnfABCDGE type electron transport complex subunit D [Candidatus Omnitrophota bacterium]|nr:RnfABCDGE type electron transport complex subunit D [Candidatus Omnitrophota bacterium]
MNTHLKTLSPHIRSRDSVAKRYWGLTLASVPVFVAVILGGQAGALRVLLFSIISAVAFDFLGAKILFKKERVNNGEAVLSATLLTLLLPRNCPFEIAVFGIFLAVFVVKELFGGTGSYLFHPVLAARIFLQMSFPGFFENSGMILEEKSALWILGGLLVSGVAVISQKNNREIPLFYIMISLLCVLLFHSGMESLTVLNWIFFTAFFLLGDSVAMPLTRKGTRIFVLGAALLNFFFEAKGFSMAAAGYAILLMNALTPWLDVMMKPAAYRAKIHLKATYP